MNMISLEENEALVFLSGNNFSGRTEYLKCLENHSLKNDPHVNFVYLGEQQANMISGICPTVENELDLHRTFGNNNWNAVESIIGQINFTKYYNKNPFQLSGGEQAMLVILCGLLIKPKILGIDITLEQLDSEWRVRIIDSILNKKFNGTKVFLVDNRFDEYELNGLIKKTLIKEETDHKITFGKPDKNIFLTSDIMATDMILDRISYSYDKTHVVLNELSVKLTSGTIYHLDGRNGAGKTTLAKIMAGVLKPQNGSILVDDKPYSSFDYPGQFVGYSFQNPDEQLFSSSVENELSLNTKNLSKTFSERREQIINIFGMNSVRKTHPAELPFVMRKRVSIAATLALDRAWYILDEPTLGQDNEFCDFLTYQIEHLANQGKGIIIISHSSSFINKLKSVTLSLIDGTILNIK